MEAFYRPSEIARFTHELLVVAGVVPEDAAIVADNLTAANKRGVDSHGIVRLPVYLGNLEHGHVTKKTNCEIIHETPSSVLVDAHDGWGSVAGTFTMNVLIEKAKKTGVAMGGVRRSNHYGIAAYYGMMPLKYDMIGLSFTNASPMMAPWGGIRPYFGTNPVCLTFPAKKERPVVYDGATTVVARGKIALHQKKGLPIPDTWGADAQGRPTTDPNVALNGLLMPMSTYKGSGFAMAVDILCGVLTGAAFGDHIADFYHMVRPPNIGHFFGVIDLRAFGDPEEFKEKIDEMTRAVHAQPLAYGTEKIYMPGEIEFDFEDEREANGCPIPEAVYKELVECAKPYNVTPPQPSRK